MNIRKYIPLSNYWICQIGGWFAFSVNSLYINSLRNVEPGIFEPWKIALAYVVIIGTGFLLTHLYRNLVVAQRWFDLPLLSLIPRAALSLLVISALLTGLEIFMDWFNIPTKYWDAGNGYAYFQNATVYMLLWSRYMVIWFSFYHLYHYARRAILAENRHWQLEHSHTVSELDQLRAQLNPHFLFNALNSLRALTLTHPDQARDGISKLSDLLRASLNAHKKQRVSLQEELDVIHDYIAIEKIRFEERLKISFHCAKDTLDFPVPAMMIQTLVENAVKHGISQKSEGGLIHLETKCVNGGLDIILKNPGKLGISKNGHGVGLENTRRRLDLLYEGNAHFNLTEHHGPEVRAHLFIPLETASQVREIQFSQQAKS